MQASEMAMAARKAARMCRKEVRQNNDERRDTLPVTRGDNLEDELEAAASSLILRITVSRGNNLPKLGDPPRLPAAQVHVTLYPDWGHTAEATRRRDEEDQSIVSHDTKTAQPSCSPVWFEKVEFTVRGDSRKLERREVLCFEVWDTNETELIGCTYLPLSEHLRWVKREESDSGTWQCNDRVWLALRNRDNSEIMDGLKDLDGPAAIFVSLSVEKKHKPVTFELRKYGGEKVPLIIILN